MLTKNRASADVLVRATLPYVRHELKHPRFDAASLGVGRLAQNDGGQREGATSEELAEIKDLKAKARRLEEDNVILRRASIFFAGGLDLRNR